MIIIMLMIIIIIIIIIKIVVMIMIIIIHNSPLQIVLSEIQILFAQLIIGPAASEQRQIDITLSLSLLNGKQGSSNSESINVFWYDAAGVRTHDLPIMRWPL